MMARRMNFFSQLVPRSKWGRYAAVGGASIVALAAVIFVVSALSTPKDSSDTALGPIVVANPSAQAPDATQTKAASLYDQAVKAIAAGDTSRARQLLKEVLAQDPNNTAAQQKLREIDSQSPPDNQTSTTPPPSNPKPVPTPRSDAAYLKPVADLRTLLPAALSGFTMGKPDGKTKVSVVTADPVPGGPYDRQIVTVNITVDDAGSAAEASKFTDRVSRKAYASDASTAQVGVMSAYFGTNGRLAELSFVRGRYVFEVIGTAGGSAAQLKPVMQAVAMGFPAAK